MWPLLHFDSTGFSVTASLGSIKVDCLGWLVSGRSFHACHIQSHLVPEFCLFRSHSSQPLAILVADHGGVIRRPEVESFLNVFSVEASDV